MKTKQLILIGLSTLGIGIATLFLYQQWAFRHYIRQAYQGDMQIPVNEQAPVVANAEIVIDTSPDRVWSVLTNIEHWPDWQTEVESAQLWGPLTAGTPFDWKAGGLRFHSVIHTAQPTSHFGWTGTTFGAYAVHNWSFSIEGHAVKVRVNESLQGFFPSLMRKRFQANLETSMKEQLEALRDFCEAQSSGANSISSNVH